MLFFFFIFCYFSLVMLSKFYLANLRPTSKIETILQPNKHLMKINTTYRNKYCTYITNNVNKKFVKTKQILHKTNI